MGTLRSKTNHTGATVNGVTLGEPVILTAEQQQAAEAETIQELFFSWDDAALPTGEMDANGTITPDEEA